MKKQPQQERARITVDAVVEAAARILGDEGYAALTTERLAEVAGVGIGSIYEYFPSKESIVAEVARRVIAEVTREIGAGATASGASPEHWLREWVRIMFAAIRSRSRLVRTLAREVPFFHEIEEVRRIPATMLAMAAQSPRELRAIPYVTPASMFLLTVMVRSAVLEGVLDRPPGIASEEIESTLAEILRTLLSAGMAAADYTRPNGDG